MKTFGIFVLLLSFGLTGCGNENLPIERQEDYRKDSFEDSKDYPAESEDEIDINRGIFNRK